MFKSNYHQELWSIFHDSSSTSEEGPARGERSSAGGGSMAAGPLCSRRRYAPRPPAHLPHRRPSMSSLSAERKTQGCHCESRHHRVPLLRMPLLRRDLGFSNEGGTPEQKGGETCSSRRRLTRAADSPSPPAAVRVSPSRMCAPPSPRGVAAAPVRVRCTPHEYCGGVRAMQHRHCGPRPREIRRPTANERAT
jgi:hypothetical protein